MVLSDDIYDISKKLLGDLNDLYGNATNFDYVNDKLRFIRDSINPDKIGCYTQNPVLKDKLEDILTDMAKIGPLLKKYNKDSKEWIPWKRSLKYEDEEQLTNLLDQLKNNVKEFDQEISRDIHAKTTYLANIAMAEQIDKIGKLKIEVKHSKELTLQDVNIIELNDSPIITQYKNNSVIVQLYGQYNDTNRVKILDEINYLEALGENENFLKCYGVIYHNKNIYMVKENLGNEDQTLYKAMKHYTLPQKKFVLLLIIKAVIKLHEEEIILKTLNSKNILMSINTIPKITDLSSSRKVSRPTTTVSPKFTSDSIKWLAPELTQPSIKTTLQVDVYSIGMILWEMLSSKELYQQMDSDEIDAIKLSEKRTHTMFYIEEYPFIMECLYQDPTKRISLNDLYNKVAMI